MAVCEVGLTCTHFAPKVCYEVTSPRSVTYSTDATWLKQGFIGFDAPNSVINICFFTRTIVSIVFRIKRGNCRCRRVGNRNIGGIFFCTMKNIKSCRLDTGPRKKSSLPDTVISGVAVEVIEIVEIAAVIVVLNGDAVFSGYSQI